MFFFFLLSQCVFCFSLLVIFFENALYSLLCVVCIVVLVCFVLFYLGVEFLTYIYLLVYIGAIATLFLFVIMLLNTNYQTPNKQSQRTSSVDFVLYLLMFLKSYLVFSYLSTNLVSFLFENDCFFQTSYLILGATGDTVLFLNLFYYYFIYFIIIGFILLLAMVGSIGLCLSNRAQ